MKQKTKPKGIKNDVLIRSRVHTFKEKNKGCVVNVKSWVLV